jgi:hypothetical protein
MLRVRRLERCDDGGGRPDAPALEEGVGKYPGPGVEQLDRFRARLDLAAQELDDSGREHVDQGLEPVGVAQRPLLDCGVLRRAAAASLDHVGGDGPRRAGVADQRDLRRQGAGQLPHRLVDRGQLLVQARGAQEFRDVRRRADGGRQHRPVAGPVLQRLAQRGGDLRQIGEENGGIEREAANRLKGDLDRVLGRVAELQHAPGRLADPVILGQVPPGLPHQPDRRPLGPLSRERPQQQLLRVDAGHRLQTDFFPGTDVHAVPSC